MLHQAETQERIQNESRGLVKIALGPAFQTTLAKINQIALRPEAQAAIAQSNSKETSHFIELPATIKSSPQSVRYLGVALNRYFWVKTDDISLPEAVTDTFFEEQDQTLSDFTFLGTFFDPLEKLDPQLQKNIILQVEQGMQQQEKAKNKAKNKANCCTIL